MVRATAPVTIKIEAWAKRSAPTILVLEDNDIVLTNQVVVKDALQCALHGRPFWPDLVYFVMTCSTTWFVFELMRDRAFAGQAGHLWDFSTFAPNELSTS